MGTKIKFSNKGMSAKPASVSSVVFEVPVYLQNWSAQTTWYIDPSAGDDNNNGAASTTALKTFVELARRLPTLTQSITINYVGTSASDILAWQPVVQSITPVIVSINGVETTAALPSGATGIINTATNGTPGTNTPPRTTDTGGAGIAWVAGTMLRVTSGTSIGAFCVVLINEGAGSALTSQWVNASGASVSPPNNGDTYKAITLTTIPDIAIYTQAKIAIKSCSFTRWLNVEGGDAANSATYYQFTNCEFPATVTFFAPITGMSVTMLACKYFGGPTFTSTGVIFSMVGCGVSLPAGQQLRSTSRGARLSLNNCTFYGSGAAATPTGDNNIGGTIYLINCSFWATGTDAVIAQRGGEIFIRTALWGTTTNKGTVVKQGGRIWVKTAIVPTLTSSLVAELEFEGAATAIPALAAGVAVPAASSLTTWAAWAAGPFTRNVLSYTTGAAILDSV
jgi:hypothetical protein